MSDQIMYDTLSEGKINNIRTYYKAIRSAGGIRRPLRLLRKVK